MPKKTSETQTPKKAAQPNFEKDMEKLEKVVADLEEGGLSLDDALKKFEEGVKLYKRCETALNAAEKRIEKLTKNADGELVASPLDEAEAAGKADDTEDEDADEETEDDDDDELLF